MAPASDTCCNHRVLEYMETIVSRLEVTRKDLGEWAVCPAYWADHVCRLFVSYRERVGWLAGPQPAQERTLRRSCLSNTCHHHLTSDSSFWRGSRTGEAQV